MPEIRSWYLGAAGCAGFPESASVAATEIWAPFQYLKEDQKTCALRRRVGASGGAPSGTPPRRQFSPCENDYSPA